MVHRVTPALLPALAFLLLTCASPASAVLFEPPVPLAASATTDDPGRSDFRPAAVTDGHGTWVVAWSGDDPLGNPTGGDPDILFARSTDGGLTFSAQSPLNTDAATDVESSPFVGMRSDVDVTPALAAHGSRFIAVWTRETILDVEVMLARSDDGGQHWSAPAVLFDNSNTPSIATDGAGTWVIVWEHGSTPNRFEPTDVYFSRSTDDGVTWSTPTALNASTAGDGLRDLPAQVLWSGGVWVAIWTTITIPFPTDSHLTYARSVDGGATWSAPAPVHTNVGTAYDRDPAITSDGDGNWVAVWTSAPTGADESDVFTARSIDGAVTWGAVEPLNTDFATDGRPELAPSVVAGSPGQYVAAWTREGIAGNGDFDHADVLTASSDDGGVTWSAPTPLNPAAAAAAKQGSEELQVKVAFDPAGYYFAAWASNDATLASGTKGRDLDVVYALAGNPCGNGVLDPGETCDDGDRGSLDCCGRACTYDAVGTACAADADPCTLERCDGAGGCDHLNAPLGTPCAADDDLCTFDRCDGNDVCEHVFEPQPVCVAPTVPQASLLQISGSPAGAKLKWLWKHGPAAVLHPFVMFVTGANSALCVYDASGLLLRSDAPVDASCAPDPSCWSPSSSGFKYRDRDGTPNGVTSVAVKSGKRNSGAKLLAKGSHLTLPGLPLTAPLRAQFVNDLGLCLDSTFSPAGVETNTPTAFKAKSD